MTANEFAFRLWIRGVSVIPIPRPPHGDGKRPRIAWGEYQRRLPGFSNIARWFAGPECNYAVITGRTSGIVVVDTDELQAVEWADSNLPSTPWRVKTSKGFHYYFRHPGTDVGNRARVDGIRLDLRGDGGYVVGPGSLHASGVIYEPEGDWDRPKSDLPVFDPALVARKTPDAPALPPARRATGEAVERARRYLSRIPVPVEGHGSDIATFGAACKIGRGFNLSIEDACELILEWAPGFTFAWVRGKVTAAMLYGDEPIGGRL